LVVATIGKKGGGFIDEVKQRSDVELWELDRFNRDQIPEKVIEWLRACQTR
jgi:nucleoside-triphosphatase THEP1